MTLRAMHGLLNGLARVPGRKSVLFMTEGFLFEESWADPAHAGRPGRAGQRAHLHARRARPAPRQRTATELSAMNPLETAGQVPTEAYNTTEEGPNTLANDTGGYVIRKTNDFAGAMVEDREATRAATTCSGSARPTSSEAGKFRELTVKVKRSGLQVRARRGYLAAGPSRAAQPAGGRCPPRRCPSHAAPLRMPPPAPRGETGRRGAAGAGGRRPPPELAAPLPAVGDPAAPRHEQRACATSRRSGAAASGEAKTLATQGLGALQRRRPGGRRDAARAGRRCSRARRPGCRMRWGSPNSACGSRTRRRNRGSACGPPCPRSSPSTWIWRTRICSWATRRGRSRCCARPSRSGRRTSRC